MEIEWFDWISLMANIVTILGIGGFLTEYFSRRKNKIQVANQVTLYAIKNASLKLHIYSLEEQRIYRSQDLLEILIAKLRQWGEDVSFTADTEWKSDSEYIIPSNEHEQPDFAEDTEAHSTDFVFTDDEGLQCLHADEMANYLEKFKQKTVEEQEDILRIALDKELRTEYLDVIEADTRISDEVLDGFIDAILRSITADSITGNKYLDQYFNRLRKIQLEIEELLQYQKLYLETVLKIVEDLENPFLYFQELWHYNHVKISFSTEEYSQRRLSVIEKMLELFDEVQKSSNYD